MMITAGSIYEWILLKNERKVKKNMKKVDFMCVSVFDDFELC